VIFFNNDESVNDRKRTERMYKILGTYADEFTGKNNDEGKADVCLYTICSVYTKSSLN
jgi:hypothetical protein